MRHPVLARTLIITLLYTAAFAAAESTFGLWAQHRYGWGPQKLSICLVFVAVTAALAQGFLTGRITRRFGEAATLAGGLTIIALTLAAQPLGQGMARTVGLLALTVFGQALALPNVVALISRTTPADRQGAVLRLEHVRRRLGASGGADRRRRRVLHRRRRCAPLRRRPAGGPDHSAGLAGGARGRPAQLARA